MTVTNKLSLAFILKIATFFSAFISSVIISRALGPDNYGIYRFIIVIVTTTYVISGVGIFESVNQSLATQKINKIAALKYNYLVLICVSLLLITLFSIYKILFNSLFSNETLFILFLIYLIMYFNDNAISNILKGEDLINQYNILSFLRIFAVLSSIIILGLAGKVTILNVLIINIIAWLVYFILSIMLLSIRAGDLLVQKIYLKDFMIILKRGFKIQISNLSTLLNYKSDIFILKIFSNFQAIGYYSVAVGLVERLWIIPESMRDIIYLEIAKNRKNSDFVCSISRITFTFLSLVSIILGVLASQLIPFIYSENYISSILPFILLLPGIVFFSLSKIIGSYFFAIDMTHYNAISSTIAFVINIVLNLILIPKIGIVGAAISTLISYSIGSLVHVFFFIQNTNTKNYNMFFINKQDIVLLKNKIGF
jgi:O-antigen/teichoic acid export membrane protein